MFKRIRLIFIGIFTVLAVLFARKMYIEKPVFYPGVTAENFAYISIPACENDGIYTDLKGFVTGDKAVLFVPCRADITKLVYYCMDKDDRPLMRYENDFTSQPGEILGVPVICMKSDLASMEIDLDDRYGTLDDVNGDEDHNFTAYGDMTLTCTDAVATENGWDSVFVSRNRKGKTPCSVGIKGRGNLTWVQDKKPYLIELEESDSLLGMADGEKWVLLANVMDHALIRNELALYLAKECGCEYVSDIQPIDLFVDGEYIGNYSLCSKVEISSSRVNINPSRDYFYRWGMPSGNYREIESTSLWNDDNYIELINGHMDSRDDEAFDIMQRVISSIEDTDSDEFLDYIDLESWARYYWVQEYLKNTDACFRSVYTYWNHEDGKVYMIAPWDFDRTIGTVEQYNKTIEYLMPSGLEIRKDEWYEPLFEHPEFVNEVRRVYFDGGIKEAFAKVSDEAADRFVRLEPSAMMNFTRWDFLDRPLVDYYNKIALLMGDSSYNSEKEWVIQWTDKRAKWIDDEMNERVHEDY